MGRYKTTHRLVIWGCLGVGIAEVISPAGPRSQLGQEGGRVRGPKAQRLKRNKSLMLWRRQSSSAVFVFVD